MIGTAPSTGGAVPDAGELVIVSNPDRGSSLGYLLRLPIAGGLVFRTAATWPRTKALFCYPVPPDAWPDDGEVVERVPLRSCVRRGAAIEVVAGRARENRSQLVFTAARGRDVVFWQSPPTHKQARPYLAAAWSWATTEPAAQERTATRDPLLLGAPEPPEPTVAEVRTWARSVGLEVPDRGRLRPEIWDAWRTAR